MINKLQIRNYALIEELEINFSKGLTIITGETGAGKSILLGALGLIMGKRADTKVLYDESVKCVVEAYFDIDMYNVQSFFEENDLDYAPQLIIRREITPAGKSRAFVNDTPVKLKILQSLSGVLVDLHLQFDTLDIHEVSFQLRMIDALAENKKILESYQKGYDTYQVDKNQLNRLQVQQRKADQETEFIQFQLEELEALQLQAGEQESLEEELARLTNAEDIKRILGIAFQHLSNDEQAIVNQLEEVRQSLNEVCKYDARVEQLFQRLEHVLVELQDMSGDFEKVAEDTEYDPERISETQQRLDTIYRLQSKHKVMSVEELMNIQEDLASKLSVLGDLTSEIARLEQSIKDQEDILLKQAKKLSKRRQRWPVPVDLS